MTTSHGFFVIAPNPYHADVVLDYLQHHNRLNTDILDSVFVVTLNFPQDDSPASTPFRHRRSAEVDGADTPSQRMALPLPLPLRLRPRGIVGPPHHAWVRVLVSPARPHEAEDVSLVPSGTGLSDTSETADKNLPPTIATPPEGTSGPRGGEEGGGGRRQEEQLQQPPSWREERGGKGRRGVHDSSLVTISDLLHSVHRRNARTVTDAEFYHLLELSELKSLHDTVVAIGHVYHDTHNRTHETNTNTSINSTIFQDLLHPPGFPTFGFEGAVGYISVINGSLRPFEAAVFDFKPDEGFSEWLHFNFSSSATWRVRETGTVRWPNGRALGPDLCFMKNEKTCLEEAGGS